jgi:hypothetical protein
MKNILSSLNESEKKRILEMHYRASGRHYLMEATNADYNVIKTAVDANYKTTLNKYLMAGVSLIEPVDGKPTKIEFIPTNPLGTIASDSIIMGTSTDKTINNPTYNCAAKPDPMFIDTSTGKPTTQFWGGDLGNYQTEYAASIGAPNDEAKRVARNELTNELGKIGAAACKAIDALSKGLPNPLIKVTTSPVKPEEKKALPATKGTGTVASSNVIGDPPKVVTADDLKTIGLSAADGPYVTGDAVEQQGSAAPYGGYFFWGGSRFECYDPYKAVLVYNFIAPPVHEPQKSAYTAYKTQMIALGKKQCLANAAWYKTAEHIYYDKDSKEIGRGIGPKKQ